MSRFKATLAPLKHRDFRRLWTGTFFATAGQWIQQATLGWVVYDVTGSASVLGAVLGTRAIPMLLLAPVSGVVADRMDRRYALAASQLLMVVVSIALSALLAFERVETWHLFAFSIFSGVSAVFDRTLRSTLIFHSVPRNDAANAVALNSVAFSVSRAVGPSVAGFLIGAMGAAWNFGIQALLLMGVVMAALSVQAGRLPAASRRQTSAWEEMKEGFRFVASDPVARMMVVLGLVPPLLLIPSFSALMPVFAADVFKAGPEGLGLMLSAVGVGGILGGLVAAWTSRYDQTGLVQMLALAVFAFSLVAFAVSPNVAVAVVFLAIAGIAEMVHHTVHVTTLQMCAPEHLRGRIASLLPIFPAFISIGALLAGVVADLLGPEMVVLLLSGLAIAVIVASWSKSSAVRELRMSRLIADAGDR
ncbi:MAG TPA: MFS transporter [Burkholderiales bacterium]|nr:MFS transporter [Burkholderiales bacterium]